MTNYQIPQTALLKYRSAPKERAWDGLGAFKQFGVVSAFWDRQGNCLVPDPSRFFYQFLLGNERATAKEIRDEYVETLSKIYLSYYRSYLGRLMKLQVTPRRERCTCAHGLGGGATLGPGETASEETCLSCGKRWLPVLFPLFCSMRKSLRRMI